MFDSRGTVGTRYPNTLIFLYIYIYINFWRFLLCQQWRSSCSRSNKPSNSRHEVRRQLHIVLDNDSKLCLRDHLEHFRNCELNHEVDPGECACTAEDTIFSSCGECACTAEDTIFSSCGSNLNYGDINCEKLHVPMPYSK